VDFLLELAEPWGYVLVGAVALAEAGLLVGLFVPGEAVMLLGGVLVYEGRASLAWMLVAAIGGAIAGNLTGYELGRRLGPRLERGSLGRRVGRERWERARRYVQDHGGRAVFLGRFVGVLRALVPPVAGSAGMPYPSFGAFSVAGGALWAGGFVALGAVAGSSWRLVHAWAGRASLILLGLAAAVAMFVLASRWVQRHSDAVVAARKRVGCWGPVAAFLRTFRPQIDFVKRRLDPRARFGLYLSVGLVLAGSAAWGLGELIDEVLGGETLAVVDRPWVSWLAAHREEWLDDGMLMVTFLGSQAFAIPIVGVAAGAAFARTRDVRWPVFLLITLAGAIVLYTNAKTLVGRPRPEIDPVFDATGFAFPSGHATTAAAVFGSVAFVLASGRRRAVAVWIWTAACFVALLIGFSRVYLGVHWPTDVIGGLLLGSAWTAITATATGVIPDVRAARANRSRRYPARSGEDDSWRRGRVV
jgi:membrane protein DedA with SNARE-associated domain/membrane-associated phospholipid phosphatase